MKKIVIFVVSCMLACTLILALLFAFKVRPYEGMNGFIRTESIQRVLLEKSLDLEATSWYFAGATANKIYLGNYKATGIALSTDSLLGGVEKHILTFDNPEVHAWEKARLTLDSPYVFLKEGISPVVYRGKLDEFKMHKTFDSVSYFTTGINISANSMIVKSVSANTRTAILAKVTNDSPYVNRKFDILTKQVDGLFCTDGSFAFDKKNATVVYTYFHRNEYIKLDSNLNITMRSHTIDTNTIAKIKIANVSSGSVVKFAAPPKYVNLLTSADDNTLYVISVLVADNEPRGTIKAYTIIDKYSLLTGSYLGTIYVPKYKIKEMKDFMVVGNKLYAIYDRFLCVYNI